MCGILAILLSRLDEVQLRKRALQLSTRLRHRGPDWSGIHVQRLKLGNQPTSMIGANANGLPINGEEEEQVINCMAHERLAIIDPDGGAQPILSPDETVCLAVNGEIYNHESLREEFGEGYQYRTGSDCEAIIPLYLQAREANRQLESSSQQSKDEIFARFVDRLDGMFAFVVADSKDNIMLAARDAIGICSMYVGWGRDGSVWFASELKALNEDCEQFQEFPPGHFWSSITCSFHRWFNPIWLDESYIPSAPLKLDQLRQAFERSVIKRLMTDVPYGVLLSGGLDSSLVASIVKRHVDRMRLKIQNQQVQRKDQHVLSWWPVLHSFSVGLKGSPDLAAARKVAQFLGCIHHEFYFTIQEGLDALSDVIYHLETYDVTTIRASTPMYLMSRKIKAMGVKMVLSGEGADEVFGGYLYFHKAPNAAEFHQETVRKLKMLSKYDCLRANKATSAWGLEARVPFLDKDFLSIAMTIDPQEKMIDKAAGRIEKYILRKAFDDPDEPYLPKEVLWRQKEQFSDGVGYGWIDALKEMAEREVTDQQLKQAKYRFPINTPTTKEAYWYRCTFHHHFPQQAAAETVPGGPSVACSTPTAIAWDEAWKNAADPSGRAVKDVHFHQPDLSQVQAQPMIPSKKVQTQAQESVANGNGNAQVTL